MLQDLLEPLLQWIRPETIITGGYVVMTIIVFVETGLLVGFFLPGDSLLIAAGMLAARDDSLDIRLVNACLIPAAILGNTVGYWIGYYAGPRLFRREKSLLFNPKHLRSAHEFYERHGAKTIVLTRFIPILRTFAPVVAGIGRMNFARYTFYNVFGAIVWVTGITVAGYYLGIKYPWMFKHLEVIIVVVVLVSVLPAIVAVFKKWLESRRQPKPEPGVEPSEVAGA